MSNAELTPVTWRAAVQCLFLRDGRVLLYEQDFVRAGRRALRAVGGGVEPGESLEEALAREVLEELGRAITEPMLLGTIEARSPWWGVEPAHRIHVFTASFGDATPEILEGADADGTPIRARWMTLEEIDAHPLPLVPEGLRAIVERSTAG